MASTAAKLKKNPAPPAVLVAAPTVITVTGGLPHPQDAYVAAGGTVQFLNADNLGYMIQLLKGNTTVLQFLPALGNTSLAVDPNAVSGTTTDYALVPRFTPAGKYKIENAIGGRIIIRP